MLDHALWGMNAWGFHLTALLLQACNGMLVHLLVTRISGRESAGLLAGLLFVVHPVQVESVAWLSQRKNLLAMFFFLTSFLLYLAAESDDRKTRSYLLLSFTAFAASLLSKSVAIVLPLCLAAYELGVHGCRPVPKLVRRLAPFIGAALVIGLLTFYLQRPELGGGRTAYYGGSPWATLLTMIPVFARYLGMIIWPSDLCAFYIPSVKTVPDPEVIGALGVLAAVCAAGATLYHRRKPLFFWFCMAVIPLLPVSQIVPMVTLMNDRYLYFPMIGVAGLAGHAMALAGTRRLLLLRFVSAAVVVALGVASFHRSEAWRNSVNLWSDATGKNPGSVDLMSVLASSYRDAGRTEDAVAAYRATFAMPGVFTEPRQEQGALLDAARLYMGLGYFPEAEPLLVRLTARFPANAAGFATLADCLAATGRQEAAEAAYHRALDLDTGAVQALIGLATLLLDRNQPDRAAALLSRAARAGADGPDLRVSQARVSLRSGNRPEALDYLQKAIDQGLANPARLRLVPDFSSLADDPRFRRMTDHAP
jgi:Flp pilus assembly protein TadD